jgi:hypothetical protein
MNFDAIYKFVLFYIVIIHFSLADMADTADILQATSKKPVD